MAGYDTSIRVHTVVDNEEIKQAEKDVQRLAKQLDNARKRASKLEVLGGSEKQFVSLGYDAEMLEAELNQATEYLERLKAINVPQDMEDGFLKATRAVMKCFRIVDKGVDTSQDVINGFEQAEKVAKKCFKAVDDGAKKNSKSLGSTMKVLKNIVISMVAFQVLTKVAEYAGAGFQNLAQYSSELNNAFSDLKSETAMLKNSMASAFEPIVNMITPAISTLVSWLNSATNAITHFWAYLGRKGTYTKAKKQVVDYAKSIKDASKSAKGALAAFDELNVLNKNESTNAGGEVTGAEAFEEVAVDESKFGWVEWLKDNLEEILSIVGFIGAGFLAWKLLPAIPSFIKTIGGLAMIAAGAVAFVAGWIDALTNGVDWGNLSAMLIGATLLIGGMALAFGPFAAAVAAVVVGIGMLWVGINDIMMNGINLKNALLIIAGTFLTVSAIAGAAVGAIAAVVAGLVLAIAMDWEDFKATVWEPMKEWFGVLYEGFNQLVNDVKRILNGFSEFFTGIFEGDFEKALEGAKEIFEGAVEAMEDIGSGFMNVIIGLINTVINTIEGAINAVFDIINSLDFTVPDWVPIIGGKQFGGFNLQPVSWADIPYLATGGTVTSATLANLGEGNKKEVVLPLEQNTEWADILADKLASKMPGTAQTINLVAELDGREVYRSVVRLDKQFYKTTGKSQFSY